MLSCMHACIACVCANTTQLFCILIDFSLLLHTNVCSIDSCILVYMFGFGTFIKTQARTQSMLLYVTIQKSQLIHSNGCRLWWLIFYRICVYVWFFFFGRLHSKSFNLNAHVNKTSAFILDIFGSQHDMYMS